jgi:hypothetical protein
MKANELRVIHLPFLTGNSAWYLSKSEKKFLLRSDVFYFTRSKKDELYVELRYDQKIESNASILLAIKVIAFYFWAISKYDIFHFNSGSSLVNTPRLKLIDFIDVKILKLFKKKVIFTYQGSPGRIRETFFSRLEEYDQRYNAVFHSDIEDNIKLKRIGLVNKYADFIYCTNPDLIINFNQKKSSFRPYTKMGLNQPIKKEFNKRLKIVHFPSNRIIKGSDYIDKVMSDVINEGFDVEYITLTGIDYKEVRNILASSDILIDQLLIGWYGGIAVEAMNYGLPVLSYINRKDLDFIPTKMKEDLPIINVTLGTLKEEIIYMIQNPNVLSKISIEGFKFLRLWHDPELIASNIIHDYESLYNEDVE